MRRPYQPHVTLAFRDLTQAGYKSGLEYLKDKDMTINTRIDHIALVEKRSNADIERFRVHLG